MIAVFQLVVLGRPIPDPGGVVVGLVLVLVGLALFVQGLEIGLFPLGGAMAEAFARRGSLAWLLAFAFALGFATTVAEPALIAIADQAAASAAKAGAIASDESARAAYARGLRTVVALAVGLALVLGTVRIVKGWPIQYFIVAGYALVVVLTAFAPDEIVAIAYDSGGVTTSTVTVPLVAALGIGLASAIRGRSPLIDGFGLIAFASLTPIAFVLVWGMVV